MTKRRFILLTLASVLIGIIMGIIITPKTKSHDTPSPQTTQHASQPCTNAHQPCIQVVDQNGKEIARVNDFRFGAPGCVFYRMSLGDLWQEHCGGYNLNWIGPGNPAASER